MKQHHLFIRAALLISALLGSISIVRGQCDGQCVPLIKCKSNFGGLNLIDVRIGNDEDDVQGECNHYLEVCCDPDDVLDGPKRTTTATVVGTDPETATAVVDYPEDENFNNCGNTNPDGVGFRIINAKHNETEFGEFPWVVAILQTQVLLDGETTTFICGGSLVAANVVLTAAHCVKDKNSTSLKARVGEWDTRTESETLPYQEQRVKNVIINTNYNSAMQFNDIALIVVEKPFRADQNVKLICLPPQGMEFFNNDCFVTGWGKTNFDSDSYQAILKKIQLPMVPHSDCQKALRTTRLTSTFRLHNSFICAGGQDGVDACTGDGGSPLICPFPESKDRYYQAGIVSWGIGCGQSGIPGVYVKNSLYTNWINQQIQELSTDDFFNYEQ